MLSRVIYGAGVVSGGDSGQREAVAETCYFRASENSEQIHVELGARVPLCAPVRTFGTAVYDRDGGQDENTIKKKVTRRMADRERQLSICPLLHAFLL